MSRTLPLHVKNPEPRYIEQAVAVLREGGVIVYPTDSCYALGCQLGDKDAQERIRRTCRSGRQPYLGAGMSIYRNWQLTRADNPAFRPDEVDDAGSIYLSAQSYARGAAAAANSAAHHGLRVPDHRVVQSLLEALGEPLMSTSAQLLIDMPFNDPAEIEEHMGKLVDLNP
ncbi:MAG: Sua5/YciO/YrdC/YwlC family protein [Gammaproteobacteria bacterium]